MVFLLSLLNAVVDVVHFPVSQQLVVGSLHSQYLFNHALRLSKISTTKENVVIHNVIKVVDNLPFLMTLPNA
jgi:hypothetical protein